MLFSDSAISLIWCIYIRSVFRAVSAVVTQSSGTPLPASPTRCSQRSCQSWPVHSSGIAGFSSVGSAMSVMRCSFRVNAILSSWMAVADHPHGITISSNAGFMALFHTPIRCSRDSSFCLRYHDLFIGDNRDCLKAIPKLLSLDRNQLQKLLANSTGRLIGSIESLDGVGISSFDREPNHQL